MSTMTPMLLIVHAAATWFMTGLIWTIQLVHYPLFAAVGPEHWCAYQRKHVARITRLVAPAMAIELAAAVLLVWATPGRLAWLGLASLGVIWLSTMAWQVPLHGALADGFDARVHRRLVASNWLRTALWSARAVLAAALLWSEM